jgi:hypothetical protein
VKEKEQSKYEGKIEFERVKQVQKGLKESQLLFVRIKAYC